MSEIAGLEGEKCVIKVTAGTESMTCKIENYAIGTKNLDSFKVFESARPIRDFVNDFSTWYVRRSRDRFKSDNVEERDNALSTTNFVLVELMKYMAPFTPFFAEHVYQVIKSKDDAESVHLCHWPEESVVHTELLEQMQKVRSVVTSALELRQKAGHKVRQPLSSLTVPENFSKELLEIISDEVNIKEVVFEEGVIKLDTNLTEELKNEGVARDLIRGIQDARKKENLSPSDKIKLIICAKENIKKIIGFYSEMIKSPTGVKEISFSKETQTHEVDMDGVKSSISLVK